MKSVYWILSCSLMFAAVMIVGLSLHSCKSKKLVESSSELDTRKHSSHQEVDDSLFFEEFFKRHRRRFTFSLTTYQFVKDSSGIVTGSVPDKKYDLSVDEDSTSHQNKGIVTREEKGDSTDVQVSQSEEHKEKPPPEDYRIFVCLILAFLIVIFIRK